MNARDAILARIKEALRTPAPPAGARDHDSGHPPTGAPSRDFSRLLPAVGDSFENRIHSFRAAAAELKADFRLFETQHQALAALQQLSAEEKWQRLGSHRGALTDAACEILRLPAVQTDQAYDVAALEACDAGLSECDALVAQTGSVVVSSRSAGGRALSVLPPHHVVLARRDQLVPDLPQALAMIQKKYGDHYPSMISFITGPSRTGDIERILVLGAHGPKKLTIFCF